MTNTAVRRLHFWYGIALGVFTAIVGILFISQAADIYYSGLDYSRELVIQRCTAIAAPFWIWVAAVAAACVFALAGYRKQVSADEAAQSEVKAADGGAEEQTADETEAVEQAAGSAESGEEKGEDK